MKTLKFNKEGNLWYIDLPEWTGPKSALLMVAGADKLLDRLAIEEKTISLLVSEAEPEEKGFEKISKMVETPIVGGAVYLTSYWPIWLCEVTRAVYDGRLPDLLYYKVAK